MKISHKQYIDKLHRDIKAELLTQAKSYEHNLKKLDKMDLQSLNQKNEHMEKLKKQLKEESKRNIINIFHDCLASMGVPLSLEEQTALTGAEVIQTKSGEQNLDECIRKLGDSAITLNTQAKIFHSTLDSTIKALISKIEDNRDHRLSSSTLDKITDDSKNLIVKAGKAVLVAAALFIPCTIFAAAGIAIISPLILLISPQIMIATGIAASCALGTGAIAVSFLLEPKEYEKFAQNYATNRTKITETIELTQTNNQERFK